MKLSLTNDRQRKHDNFDIPFEVGEVLKGGFAGIWPVPRDHYASSCPHAQLVETTPMVLTPGFCDFYFHRSGSRGS